jgi:tetratricopeptide (TPR) repeat protein
MVQLITFVMKPPPYVCKRRARDWAWLLVFAVIPLGQIRAEDHPSSFEEIVAEATAAQDVNDIPRAIDLYTQALQLNPKWQDGWWSLGLLQYGSGAYASATDALSHLLVLHPDAGQALALRGLCEFETGDYSQSLPDLQRGVAFGAATDAHNEQILRYHEALLLARLGRFQEALRSYSVFAEHKISNPNLLLVIGLAGLRMPLLPENVSVDQKELLTAAGNATFQFMAGDIEAAQTAFNDLFQRFPTAPNAHFLYGNLLYAFGPDAAVPQFKKELEIAPDNANARTMLAWSLLMQNRADEALPYAKRIAEEAPERPASQLTLGRALLETGDIGGGIQHLEQARQLQPDNIETHIALAKAYSKSGRDDDARRERALCRQMTENSATSLAHP